MRPFLVFVPILIGTASSVAHGQSSQTTSTEAITETSEGRRMGCNLTFFGVMEDYKYRKGGLVRIVGSLAFRGYGYGSKPDVSPFIAIKFTVNDLDDLNGRITLTPNAPSIVVPLGMNDISARDYFISSIEPETPGSWIGIYKLDAMNIILDRIYGKKELAFAFNREPGGEDLHIIIDLTVGADGKPDGNKTTSDFVSCLLPLLEEVREKLQK